MKIVEKEVTLPEVPAVPARVVKQRFVGCEQCDFTAVYESVVHEHVAHSHTYTKSTTVTDGDGDTVIFRLFETEEAFDAFNNTGSNRFGHGYCTWDGPGWYRFRTEESGDYTYVYHKSAKSIVADARIEIEGLQKFIEQLEQLPT